MHKTVAILALGLVAAAPATAQSVTGSAVELTARPEVALRSLSFAARLTAPRGTLIIPLASATLPDLAAAGVEPALQTSLERSIAGAKFTGKAGALLSLRGLGAWDRVVLVGTGSEATGLRDALGKAAQEVRGDAGPVGIWAMGLDAPQAALGYALGRYRFDRYKTANTAASLPQEVTVGASNPAQAEQAWRGRWSALLDGVTLSRDLASEPANVTYPESFVARVRTAFANTPGVRIEVLDEPAMRRLGMGALLGVGQGSRRPSRLLVVSYTGGSGAPLAIVGKGITFDSGGISIKPALGMWEMKADMSGAASAMGAVLSLAKSRAPVNVVAAAALAENMPGGNAQRPGDVVRTFSGKTIEVLNTDAEGRLVMADATEYLADRYRPSGIVTIATLTGAVVNALDDEYAGLFARDEPLAQRIAAAGQAVGEPVWRLPVHPNYADDMKSDIADIKNVVEGGRPGASLAAHFVQYFVPQPTAWAHLDIAGVNWADKATSLAPKGATGWGVMLLDRLARGE